MDVEEREWRDWPPEKTTGFIVHALNASGFSVVMMHARDFEGDDGAVDLSALETVIDSLRRARVAIVPLEEIGTSQ